MDRASAATKVASISTKAISIASGSDSEDKAIADKAAYEACVKAKTAWLEGRMNNDRLENIIETLSPSKPKP